MSKAVPSSALYSPILKDKNLSKISYFDQNFHCSNMSGTWHRNEMLGFHQLWNSLGLNKLSRPQCKQYISREQRWGNHWSPQAKSTAQCGWAWELRELLAFLKSWKWIKRRITFCDMKVIWNFTFSVLWDAVTLIIPVWSMAARELQWLSRLVITETAGPAKPKTLPLGSFANPW